MTNGSKYVGEYKDDKRNGHGTLTFADGDKYVGEWKDNNYHGQGTYTFADGDKRSGLWINGEFRGSRSERIQNEGKYKHLHDDGFVD